MASVRDIRAMDGFFFSPGLWMAVSCPPGKTENTRRKNTRFRRDDALGFVRRQLVESVKIIYMDGWMDGWMGRWVDGFSMRGRSMRANDGMMAIDGRWMVDASTARSIVGRRSSARA